MMPARSLAARRLPPLALVERGDLAAFISAHKETLPGEGSNGYVDPTADEADLLAEAVGLARSGALEMAVRVLDDLGYELVVFRDRASGEHLMLRERPPVHRGWGLLLLRRSDGPDLTVEVTHPIWDSMTPELGIEAYLRLGARYFLMAGAHRYANGPASPISDMTRNPASAFQRLHRALSGPTSYVLQVHGFSRKNHPDYPNAVLSNGSPEPYPELHRFAAGLEARGESAGVFDGLRWARLGATRNPQGAHTRRVGGRFYHVELRHIVRANADRRAAVVEAFAEAVLS